MKKFIKNEYVFSIISRFISVFVGLVQSILVARFLGAELQGVNSYISSSVGIGAIIITFGMHQAYPYYRKKEGKEAIYNNYLSLIILIYIFFLIISCLSLFLKISYEYKVIAILIPLFGYAKIMEYICLVEKPNLRNLFVNIAGILEVVFVLILFLIAKRSIFWAISILAFVEVIKAIIFTITLKPKIVINKELIKLNIKLVNYGFFPMIALLMTTLNYRIDVLMLKHYPYITNSMIGVYALGIQMAERIIMIPDTLKGVLVSKLAKGCDNNEVAFVCRISFFSSLIMCILFIILGPFVIDVLYGNDYKDAYLPLLISSFGTIAISYFKLIAQYNIVNKKQKLNVYMLSIAIIVDVVFNLILIPIMGINGAALATGLGNLVCGIVFVLWYKKETNIPLKLMIIPQSSDISKIKKIFNKEKIE